MPPTLGNALPSAVPSKASDPTSYSYADIEGMLLEDGDFWNNFKYLPKLQVIAYPLKYDPHAGEPRLPNVLAKRLLVGTWSKNGDHIYAYGHGNGSKHSVINQVSYFRTGKQGFQQVSILAPEIQLRQPFDDLSAQRAETFGTRLRFLVLFYFMEKGFLDRLTVTKEGLSPIQLCCERIAAQSKSAGIQPVRFRRPTRETKKAQKAKVPGKTSTQQPAKNVAASPSATQSAQCVRSVPKDNSVHQGTTPMSRPSGQGCASDGSIPKAHPILGGRYEKSHAAASKVATPTKAPKSSVEKASEHCQNPGPSRQASEIDQDPLTDFKAEPSESSINDGNRPNMKRRSEADPSDTQGSSKRHQTDAGFQQYQVLVQQIRKQTSDELQKVRVENANLRREVAEMKKTSIDGGFYKEQAENLEVKVKELEEFRNGIKAYTSRFQPSGS